MPLYEYRCEACKIKFDLLRRFADADAPARCPQCGQDSKRALSRVVALRGSGGEGAESADGSSCAGCSSGNCAHCGH